MHLDPVAVHSLPYWFPKVVGTMSYLSVYMYAVMLVVYICTLAVIICIYVW